MLRNTGEDMWPQPGMKAENRPASPPTTKRWMWSGPGTTGMRKFRRACTISAGCGCNLAVALVEGQLGKEVIGVHRQIAFDVVRVQPLAAMVARARGRSRRRNGRSTPRCCWRSCSSPKNAVEDALGVVGDVVRDAVRRLGGDDKDARILGRHAFFDVVGRPRARFLVLGDAIAVFAGMTERPLSRSPGQPPPTSRRTRRKARPIVALARLPEPKALQPPFMPIARATGPLTIRSGAAMWVVACTPFRLKAFSASARIAARTTGAYSGLQPPPSPY